MMMTCKRTHRSLHLPTALMLAILLCWPASEAIGQEEETPDKIITNAQLLGFGAINILDTYLSPEKYQGSELRYISHTIRERPGKRWSKEIMHQGSFADASDRSEDGNELSGLYTLTCVFQRDWSLASDQLGISIGGMTRFNIGVNYNSRNQNNPAQLRLSMQVGPSASATYHFRLFKKAFTARYELSVPLLGLMFSPNYGQSYYEIFSRGNYEHNAVVTTPFSSPSMHNMLTLDTKLWGTTLRIGYLGDIQQARVNGLKQHYYTHGLLIGFVKHFKTKTIQRP